MRQQEAGQATACLPDRPFVASLSRARLCSPLLQWSKPCPEAPSFASRPRLIKFLEERMAREPTLDQVEALNECSRNLRERNVTACRDAGTLLNRIARRERERAIAREADSAEDAIEKPAPSA